MGGKVTGLSRLLGGTIDAATGNFTDIDKESISIFIHFPKYYFIIKSS